MFQELYLLGVDGRIINPLLATRSFGNYSENMSRQKLIELARGHIDYALEYEKSGKNMLSRFGWVKDSYDVTWQLNLT